MANYMFKKLTSNYTLINVPLKVYLFPKPQHIAYKNPSPFAFSQTGMGVL